MRSVSDLLDEASWTALTIEYDMHLPTHVEETNRVSTESLLKGNLISSPVKRLVNQYPPFMGDSNNLYIALSHTYCIPNAIISPGYNSIFGSNGCEIPITYSSYHHYLTAKTIWARGHSLDLIEGFHGSSITDRAYLSSAHDNYVNGTCLYLSSHGDNGNYWHWSFDALSRLLLLKANHIDLYSACDYIIIATVKPLNNFQKEHLCSLLSEGHGPKLIVTTKPIKCAELIVHNPDTPIIHSKRALNRFRDTLLNLMKVSLTVTNNKLDRVFLKRTGSAVNGRILRNEGELVNQLERLGFIAIDPLLLSVYDQLSLVNGASTIVGVHGSGFVNMIAMNKGCSVIELMGESYLPIHDCILSNQLGLNYSEVRIIPEENKFGSNFTCEAGLVLDQIREII